MDHLYSDISDHDANVTPADNENDLVIIISEDDQPHEMHIHNTDDWLQLAMNNMNTVNFCVCK